jgi:hypothetical protein
MTTQQTILSYLFHMFDPSPAPVVHDDEFWDIKDLRLQNAFQFVAEKRVLAWPEIGPIPPDFLKGGRFYNQVHGRPVIEKLARIFRKVPFWEAPAD